MSRLTRWARGAVVLVVSVGVAAGVAAEPVPVLVIESDGVEAVFAHPADAALVRALKMLPTRLGELHQEIPDLTAQTAAMIQAATEALGQPMRLAVVHSGNPEDGPMGYAAELAIRFDDPQQAAALHQRIMLTLGEAEAEGVRPSADHAGMFEIDAPAGPILFGPRGDGEYVVSFGQVPAEGLMPATHADSVLRIHADLRGLAPMIEMALAESDGNEEDLEIVRTELTRLGIIGDKVMSLTGSIRHADGGLITEARIANLEGLRAALDLPRDPIDPAVYAAIPADVWTVLIGRADLGFVAAIMDKLAEHGVEVAAFEEQFEEMAGFNLRDDLIASIGGHAAVYMSDSTGGGGLLSAVVMVELTDRDKLTEIHSRLTQAANGAAMMIPVAGRYIRVASWEHDGLEMFSLRFPGVPIPLEPTWTIAGNWLIVAANPQGALVAARQVLGDGGPGLDENRSFAESVGGKTGVVAVAFIDADRSFRGGYSTISLLGSALGNAARSPWDPSRDPGLIVPSYAELAALARPEATWARWDGDDLLITTTSSGSMLAGGAVELGMWGGGGLSSFAQLLGPMIQAARQGN